jgi:membrane-bound lytic murein transglycosylase D
VGVHVADTGQLSLAPEVILNRTVLKARKGDSVASLARRYRISNESVAEWNKVNASAVFKVGQEVVLFLPVQSKTVTRINAKLGAKTSTRQARAKPAKPARVSKR